MHWEWFACELQRLRVIIAWFFSSPQPSLQIVIAFQAAPFPLTLQTVSSFSRQVILSFRTPTFAETTPIRPHSSPAQSSTPPWSSSQWQLSASQPVPSPASPSFPGLFAPSPASSSRPPLPARAVSSRSAARTPPAASCASRPWPQPLSSSATPSPSA